MDVNATRSQGTLIIRPNGRLEGSNSQEFHETITKTIGPDDENILLDLEQISYVSSAGLRSFAIIAKEAQRLDLKFALCSAGTNVRDVINTSGFNQLMPMHKDQLGALASLAAPTAATH